MPRHRNKRPKKSAIQGWREGSVDACAEHFELRHQSAPTVPIARVGRSEPFGLTVELTVTELPEGVDEAVVRRHVGAELDFWCRPKPDDPWYLIDLWFLLAEHALTDPDGRGRVRWHLVTPDAPASPDQRPYVLEVTRLAKEWMRSSWRDREPTQAGIVEEVRHQLAFIRDYVSVMVVDENPERLTLGRLRRLVNLQTGRDPSAHFELSLFGEDFEDLRLRIQRFADIDFVDAQAVSDYGGFVVTKLTRKDGPPPEPWSRGEVRKLLRHVSDDFDVHGDSVDLLADAEGPHVLVRFDESIDEPE